MTSMDDFAEAIEIIPSKLYFVAIKRVDALRYSSIAQANVCFNIDDKLLYEPFFKDFGPLNLGRAYRFCEITKELLQRAETAGKRLYFYTGPHGQYRANAAVLVGMFQVLVLNRTADDAYSLLTPLKPFFPFRDASCGPSTFNLTVQDCIKGIDKAKQVGFLDFTTGKWHLDITEYEHYEQVENGDLNWIVPGKLVAFSGPAERPTDYVGFRAMVPEDYWEYYHKKGVTAVVRLNKKVYDAQRFKDGGFRHHELYFPDGSCPTEPILMKFLEIVEREPGALAVHCKAGLGRTGVLICCYIMKHYRFTAEEVLGYIRICRPGSVIGPQQNFLRDWEARMWQLGDMMRANKSVATPAPAAIPASVPASGRSTPSKELSSAAAGGRPVVHVYSGSRPGSSYQSSRVDAGSHDTSVGYLTDRMGGLQVGAAAPSPYASTNGNNSRPQSRGRSTTPKRSSPGGLAAGSILSARAAVPAAFAKSTPSMGFVRSNSVDRTRNNGGGGGGGGGFGAGVASLRATLHTDTLSAATRPGAQMPDRISQSSDFASSGWRTAEASGVPAGALPRPQSNSNVSRVLAPNGQPRKVPSAMLGYMQGFSKPSQPQQQLTASADRQLIGSAKFGAYGGN